MNRVRIPLLTLLLATTATWLAASQVPIEIVGKIVFVKAKVNGFEPMTFIVDTGASETVLTPSAAKQAGVAARYFTPAQKKGTAPLIAVGDAVVHDLPVFIFDPPQALSLRLDKGVDYQGILGYTFLSRFITTIDYGHGWVRFDPLPASHGRADLRDPAAHTVPFQVVEHLIRAKGFVNGKGPMEFLVDCGSAEVLIVPGVADSLGIRGVVGPQYPGVGFATLNTLALGDATVAGVPAIVRSLMDGRAMGLGSQGIVGYPFLSHFVVTFNYRDKVLTLKPADASPK